MHGFPPGTLTGTSGLELAFNERLSGRPGGQLARRRRRRRERARRRARARHERAGARQGRAHEHRPRAAGERRSRRWAASTAAPRCSTPATASVLALAGLAYSAPAAARLDLQDHHRDRRPGRGHRQALRRRSRSSRRTPRSAARSRTPTTSSAAAPSPRPSPTPATRSSPRSGAELGGRASWSRPPSSTASTRRRSCSTTATTAVVDPPAEHDPDRRSRRASRPASRRSGRVEVLATPLEMATVSQTIANGGVRLPTPIARDAEPQTGRRARRGDLAARPRATLKDLMVGVVEYGTGTAAAPARDRGRGQDRHRRARPGGARAGAGARPRRGAAAGDRRLVHRLRPGQDPKIAVAVMVVNSDGDGGTVAAPIVRQIMAVVLRRRLGAGRLRCRG